MNHQDSSSDDVPYLPPEQFSIYEQERNKHLSRTSLSQLEQRRGRSHFSDNEIEELDAPSEFVDVSIELDVEPRELNTNTIPRPLSISSSLQNDNTFQREATGYDPDYYEPNRIQKFKISWGRRALGILLIIIPAVLFSVAAHFVDWPMSEFQLFSASIFIFQGVFWPSFGILLTDLFCTGKKPPGKADASKHCNNNQETSKWILFLWTVLHGSLTSGGMILQLLSIQKLNISISLALSFGFDAVVALIRYISQRGTCSAELLVLSSVSYAGYAVAAVPAFVSTSEETRTNTAIGVGASIGAMLLCLPSSLLLTKLRKQNVSESTLATVFAFFGCILALVTKEIMGKTFNLRLNAQSVGWAAGLISVVFLGTIFLFLETKLSSLIWQRDDDRPREFSSITRTRIAIFLLSCLWELGRQGFRDTVPNVYDVLAGILVMMSFLLTRGYEAWIKSCQNEVLIADSTTVTTNANEPGRTRPKFCAFVPWLMTRQKSYNHAENEK